MAGARVLVIDDSPTITRVVQLVLTKAGYDVASATDGEEGLAQARAQRPDLILLDFVMPRLNGYQVCRELAADPALRDVPVVLLSAKGDQVGERFVKVMGIVDYITKPFSPEAITAVVAHTLAKYGRGEGPPQTPGSPVELPEPTPLPVPIPGLEREGTAPRQSLASRQRKKALAALRDALAAEVDGAAELYRSLHEITDERLEEALRVLGATHDPTVVLDGELQTVPIAGVLDLLAQQRQTGVLAVTTTPFLRGEAGAEAVAVSIHFRQGKVEFASSTGLGEEFLIGRYLVEQGAIPAATLEEVLAGDDDPRPLGERLVSGGHVSEDQVRAALRRQTAERIYEALRWTAGRFTFRATFDLGRHADGAALEISLDTLLLEGSRRIDEWHLIEREVDDFDAVYLRNEEAVKAIGQARLSREELLVLDLVSGKNSVRDIVQKSRLASFEVTKMLFRLRTINLIRRRVSPVAI